MKRAVLYARFSPRRNEEESLSNGVQITQMKDYCAKEGIRVEAVFQDVAISGSIHDRPGLNAALGELKRGDILLVYQRDRLAREVLLAELIRRQVAAAGATIRALSGDIEGDPTDPTICFVRQIMDAVAELARKQTAQRTRDSMRTHQANGLRMGRFPPYGWEIDPESEANAEEKTRLRPREAEQPAIKRIIQLENDGLPPGDIVHVMNREMKHLARGKEWGYRTIRKILDRNRG